MKYRAAALLGLAAILPACDPSSSDLMLDAVLLSVSPASPNAHQLPTFSGRAAPGATIEIFTNPTASGVPAATGTASSSGAFDLVVAVPRPSQRTYYAFSTPARAPRSGPSNGLPYASRLGGFDAVVPIALSAFPVFIATADFNLDTRADLAVTCVGADSVTVLLGNGDGTFAAAPAAPVVTSPVGIAAADFDGDAIPDLAVTSFNADAVVILSGDGTGAFTPGAPVPVGDAPFALAAGDLDGGGTVDLVVANATGDSISVLLGAGDGTFTAGTPILVGDQPIGVILADLDGGLPDLLVACEVSSELHILLNAGGGGFAPAVGSPQTVPLAAGLAAADFDGDGRTDAAATGSVTNTVHTFLGDGSGALLPTAPPTLAAGSSPVFVTAADLDGDGEIDLLASNQFSDTLSFFAGDGAGGFASGASIPAGGGPRGIAVADFNGDGAPDVAVVQSSANAVGILLAK